VNIVLDPVFIFVLDMGVQGAALATVMMDRQTIMTASKPDNKRFFI